MYDRKKAYTVACAESHLPKDKIQEILAKKKFFADECDVSSFDRLNAIKMNTFDFVDNGRNLLIWSTNTGNGKTSWACKIALEYIINFIKSKPDNEDGCPIPSVLFLNVPEYFMKKKLAIDDDSVRKEVAIIDRRINTASLVIWDDIAFKSDSKYEDNLLYLPLNNRIENRKANIFTSNVSINDMQKVVSPAIASRIMYAEADNNIIELKGRGKRSLKR